MRVTNRMMVDTVINNLQANVETLDRIQNQVSSGKRVSRPADDPAAAALGVRLRHEKATDDQWQRNIEQSRSWLDATDQAMSDVGNALSRIRELAVQAANDTYSPEDRAHIADEIEQLHDHLAAALNTTVQGDQYIFAGTKTSVAPFANDPATHVATYTGNSAAIRREVGPGTYMQVNVTGDNFTAMFGHVEALVAALRDQTLPVPANTPAADKQAIDDALGNVDADTDLLLTQRASVGAKLNRLEFTQNRMADLQTETGRLQSVNEDLDFAEALTRLTTQQGVYRAALEAGARTAPMSILDFLR
jgi:flagellar hook-associated protein 3 FlgL